MKKIKRNKDEEFTLDFSNGNWHVLQFLSTYLVISQDSDQLIVSAHQGVCPQNLQTPIEGTSKMFALNSPQDITFGRASGSTIQLSEYQDISKKHATIKINERGEVSYVNTASLDVIHYSGLQQSPQRQKEVVRELSKIVKGKDNPKLTDCGWASREGTLRTENQDRACIESIPAMSTQEAGRFLDNLVNNDVNKAVYETNYAYHRVASPDCGSTIAAVVPSDDGKLICTYLGDAMIGLVGRDEQGNVRLVPLFLPHNTKVQDARLHMPEQSESWATEELLQGKLTTTEVYDDHLITSQLRRPSINGASQIVNESDRSKIYTVDPIEEMKRLGLTYDGYFVASDGVASALKGAGEALTSLLAESPSATAQERVEAVVYAAALSTGDDTTFCYASAQSPAFLAVADGNGGSSIVAETAISVMRQKIKDLPDPNAAETIAQTANHQDRLTDTGGAGGVNRSGFQR